MLPSALLGLTLLAAPPQPVTANVPAGLRWLTEQQKEEGNWYGRADSLPTSTTATAGLALLMEGSTLRNGTYARPLQKAVEWMENNVQPTGQIGGKHRTETARGTPGHADALLFLACVYDIDDDPGRRKRLGAIIERAIAYAIEIQSTQGGWGMTPRPEVAFDEAQTTIQMLQALGAAQKAGFDVPKSATRRATLYLTKCTTTSGDLNFRVTANGRGAGQPHLTAGAAAAVLLDEDAHSESLVVWLDALRFRTIPPWPERAASTTLLYQYNLARTAYALGESGHQVHDPKLRDNQPLRWSGYRAAAFQSVRQAQSPDGSWPGQITGTVYTTAIALIILQMENDYLPAFSR